MANFSKLPNELVIQIWGYVIDPEDVESFALVSKGVYDLAAPFLREHARLKQIWSEIDYLGQRSGSGAAKLLQEVLLNPRIALYIKELQIQACACDWVDQVRMSIPYSRDTMDLLKEAIQSSSLIASSEIEDWVQNVEPGDEDPILALIVMQLTKLRRFELSKSEPELLPYLFRTLAPITKSSQTATHSALSGGGSESKNSYQVDLPRPSALSNVSQLTLKYFGNIELNQFSRLLRSTRNLQSFDHFEDTSPHFEPHHLCSELLKCSRHSLRWLRYQRERSQRSQPSNGLGDITGFKILAELKTDFVLLLGSENEAYRKLADVLPMSIERVTLFMSPIITADALGEVVLNMVQSKMKRLPNLKAFTIDLSWDFKATNKELITELEGKSTDIGVLLSTRADYWQDYYREQDPRVNSWR